jgi:CheY-like chemotaxis protein
VPPVPNSILIVEDDFDIREALTQILRDEGYEVVGAGNGAEAMDVLHHNRAFGLILLDLMMPVMDGWQFRTEQQRDPALASIPVLVLSADAHIQQRAAALAAAGHLKKPVELDALLDTVGRFFPGHGAGPI